MSPRTPYSIYLTAKLQQDALGRERSAHSRKAGPKFLHSSKDWPRRASCEFVSTHNCEACRQARTNLSGDQASGNRTGWLESIRSSRPRLAAVSSLERLIHELGNCGHAVPAHLPAGTGDDVAEPGQETGSTNLFLFKVLIRKGTGRLSKRPRLQCLRYGRVCR